MGRTQTSLNRCSTKNRLGSDSLCTFYPYIPSYEQANFPSEGRYAAITVLLVVRALDQTVPFYFPSMNVRKIRKWLADIAADVDHFLETYWRNVFAVVGILLLWVLIVAPRSSDQFIPDPLAWNNPKDQDGWWCLILFLICVYALVTRLFAWVNNEGMVNLWVAVWCVGLFYLATDPIAYYTGRSYRESWTFALHQNFHGWSVFWGACWLGFIASYTLMFIFHHHRVKLRTFWIWFLLNLAVITFFYWWTSWIGVLVAFLTPHFLRPWLVAPSEQTVTLDGRMVVKRRDADRFYRGMTKRKPQLTVLLGGLEIPFSELPTHVVAFGATGSGKTLTLLLLVKNFLYQIYPGSPYKAIIYDAAREAPALLQGMAVGAKVYLLNPLDARSVRWNLAEDFTDLTQAWTLAEILAPQAGDGDNGRYFREAAVAVLYGVISFYTLNAPGCWRLADIIRACQSETVLRAILESDDRTKDALAVLATDKTSASILSTILTEIKKYAIIAALWETCTESISVKEFLKGGGIAVLGRDEEAPNQVNALNRLWLLKTSQALLNAPSVQEPQTLLLLDETASFKVERLSTMAAELRKKGGFLVLGIQNIRRMNAVYGADETATIVSQCRHKALLRVEDEDTAEFCSKLIGDAEVKIMTSNYQWEQDVGGLVGHGEKSGISEQRRFQRAVLPSNFQNLQPVDFSNNVGLSGYFISRFVHQHTYSVQELKELLPRPDDTYPNFVPKDPQFMQLMPWTDADLERLGLTEVFQKLRLKELEEKLGQASPPSPLPVTPVPPPWLGGSVEVGAEETFFTEEPEENIPSWYTTQPDSFQQLPRRSPDRRIKRTGERQPRKPPQRREPPHQERDDRKR
ncbi:type IV secretion system DNA-binding domain-containing protein [Nostoc sp. ChiQUE01b]|uniref:type IV secretion system DNA-binding domain-containing protein n=1 Tax=Nostoc sp. ChiQUE01b TaxID=3075376 RepID=UPI002AD2CF66|nr:type IV secretion system DNA-binding domain-containing protein [Nostoc sp. ChiQUE01b]MDZ8260606.1 type IV secretion system DNA-binding domain-containing protein [Nostoc sp. ChiQUE01b]